MHPNPNTPSRRALVLIAGTVDCLSNQGGRRVAEALGELGFRVDVTTLDACPAGEFEICVLSDLGEILVAHGDEADGLSRLAAVGGRCRAAVSLAIDGVATHRYHRILDLSTRAGTSLILDLGLFDQSPLLNPQDRANYRFMFSGLTPSEARLLESLGEDDRERTIPWAFVGGLTPHRAALADRLVQRIDPRGFLYMPWMPPGTEDGWPSLDQGRFEQVLRRTRYQVWYSNHPHFSMETERFRTSLLTGGVPIKIVPSWDEVPEWVPLSDLIMEAADVDKRLGGGAFPELRRRFRDEWRRLPTLCQGLAGVLEEIGIEPSRSPSIAA